MLMDVLPGVFMRRDPAAAAAPVVFDIPRSGDEYPRDFRPVVPLSELQRSVSSHVEALYAGVPEAGATWLYACFPNVYIDPNRNERDMDPAMLDGTWPDPLEPSDKTRAGNGLIPTQCTGGVPIYAGKIPVADVRARLDNYYLPYHRELSRILTAFRSSHGIVLHMSCHSMTSVNPASDPEAGRMRSDFDLGDRRGTTCAPEVTALAERVLSGFGYRVTRNRHFAGAESVRRHGDPAKGIHSLQIEINRAIYMDETTRVRGKDFGRIAGHLTELARELGKFTQAKA